MARVGTEMKRLLAIAVTLAALAVVAGCGGDDDSSSDDGEASATTTTTTEASKADVGGGGGGAEKQASGGFGSGSVVEVTDWNSGRSWSTPTAGRCIRSTRSRPTVPVLRRVRRCVAAVLHEGRAAGREGRKAGSARDHRPRGQGPGDLRRPPAVLLRERGPQRGAVPGRRGVRRPVARGRSKRRSDPVTVRTVVASRAYHRPATARGARWVKAGSRTPILRALSLVC